MIQKSSSASVEPKAAAHFDGVVAAQWLRMSAWSIVFLTFKFFWHVFITNWSTLFALFVFLSTRENLLLWIVMGGGATALLLIGFGLASFLRFRFSWDEENLYIRSGVFNRKTVRISFDRIQAVNTSQNLLHRVLGLVSIQVDTAGSSAKEAEIIAVRRAFADELSEKVFAFKQQQEEEDIESATVESSSTSSSSQKTEELFRLKTFDLLLFGLFANHLQTFGFIFAFGVTIIQQLQDVFEDSAKLVEENSEQLVQFMETHVYLSIVLIMLFSILLTIGISVIRTMLVHYNTLVSRTEKGYRKESGLLTRKKMELGLSKVQILLWSTNPFKKAVDMYGLILMNASPAAANLGNTLNKRFYVPAMSAKNVMNMLTRVLDRTIPDIAAAANPVHPQFVFRKSLYYGLIPAAFMQTLFMRNEFYWGSIFSVVWLLGAFTLAYIFRRNYRLEFDEKACYTQTGIFGRTWKAMEWYKVHNVQISLAPHQRRKGLCNLSFYNAGQKVTIPYIAYADAIRIRELVQWKVNTTQKHWM